MDPEDAMAEWKNYKPPSTGCEADSESVETFSDDVPTTSSDDKADTAGVFVVAKASQPEAAEKRPASSDSMGGPFAELAARAQKLWQKSSAGKNASSAPDSSGAALALQKKSKKSKKNKLKKGKRKKWRKLAIEEFDIEPGTQ